MTPSIPAASTPPFSPVVDHDFPGAVSHSKAIAFHLQARHPVRRIYNVAPRPIATFPVELI